MAEPVYIGKTYAGVEWVVYPRPGDSVAQFQARVDNARDRFRQTIERQERNRIKVSRLTEFCITQIEDKASLAEDEYKQDYEDMIVGKTYIIASRRLLDDVADQIAAMEDDIIQQTTSLVWTERPERIAFAERSTQKAVRGCVKKIKKAVWK